jgi:hypothetical protein
MMRPFGARGDQQSLVAPPSRAKDAALADHYP